MQQIATNLSPLTSGSRQITIVLEEGRPIEIDAASLVATAAHSNIGVATALRLISYCEEVSLTDSKDSGGIPFIKAVSSQTGNGALIPVPRSFNGSFLDSFAGDYSSGTTSVVVSSARQAEKVLISYDPLTFGDATETRTTAPFKMAYSAVATFNDLGQVGTAWDLPAFADVDIVIAGVGGGLGAETWVCVRKDTALNRIFASALTVAASTVGSRSIRLAAENPIAGVGYTVFDSQKKALYLAADIHLVGAQPAVEFSQATPVLAGSPVYDSWVAYKVSALSTAGVSGDVYGVFFGTATTPPDGSVASTRPVWTICKVNAVNGHARRIRTVWNAEMVVGSNDQRYGGVNTY